MSEDDNDDIDYAAQRAEREEAEARQKADAIKKIQENRPKTSKKQPDEIAKKRDERRNK
jgi:hypothetical protein